MKRILALILSALLLLSALAACTPAENTDDPFDTTAPSVSSPEKIKEIESTISVTTSNYQINNAVLAFFFNMAYNNDLATYGNYLITMGLDPETPLKDQKYGDGTWFDIYLDRALSNIKSNVLFAEIAKEQGITLTEQDKTNIDSYIKSIKDEAAKKSISEAAFIEDYFGVGVTEETIRKCLELQEISYKAYLNYMESLSFEDAEYDKYFSEHKNDFMYVRYYAAALSVTIPEDATEDETRTLKDELIAAKDSLITAKTEEEFKEAYTKYLKKKYEGNDAKTDLVIKNEVEGSLSADTPISQLSSLGFDPNAEIEEGLSAVSEGTNRYTVYFIANDPARSDYRLRNIRHIMLTPSQYKNEEEARNKAAEILNEYLEGEQTEEAFGKLATKYSADSSSKDNGGLYENVAKNDFQDASFNDWIFDPARVAGDTGIVGTSAGYHVMYYAGEAELKWKIEVSYALQEEAYLKKLDELSEKYSYTVNEDNLKKFEQ